MATKSRGKASVAVGPVETGSSRSVAVLDDGLAARVIAAVTRSAKMIEGTKLNKKSKPAEGSCRVKLNVEIEGDITVGAASPGYSRSLPDFEDDALIGALLAELTPQRRAAALEGAMATIRRAKTNEVTALKLAGDIEHAASLVRTAAGKAKLMVTKVMGARTGAVLGQPRVRVTGSIDTNGVEFEIASGERAEGRDEPGGA